MAGGRQLPDVVQPQTRNVVEKNPTHVAWGPAGIPGDHGHKHGRQVVDATRDVLEGTCEIEKDLVSEKEEKQVITCGLKKEEHKQIGMVFILFTLTHVQMDKYKISIDVRIHRLVYKHICIALLRGLRSNEVPITTSTSSA